MKALITGATGNVGQALLKALADQPTVEAVAAVHDVDQSKDQFEALNHLECRHFDFEQASTLALAGVDLVSLLVELCDLEAKPLRLSVTTMPNKPVRCSGRL